MVMIERKPNGDCYSAWGEGTETRFTAHDAGQYASANDSDGRLRIERNGDVISTYYFDPQIEEWKPALTQTFSFTDPVYIGFCSFSWTGETITTFRDVVLTTTSSMTNWTLY